MKKYILSMLVYNNPGVLARISILFCRKNFNIDSITSSSTSDKKVSRITFVIFADENSIDYLVSQTENLEETKLSFILEESESIFRELLLLKLKIDKNQITEIKEISEIFGARILDLSTNTMILELTENEKKIDAFLEILEQYQVLEVCRTGITGMKRGLTIS